jgi:hypothetical protein
MLELDDLLRAAVAREDHAAIAAAFEGSAKDGGTRARAWRVLGEIAEAAVSGQQVQRGKAHYEREIRRIGRVVAWRESKVSTQRSLGEPGAVNVRVEATVESADALVRDELGAADLTWGLRPRPGDLADRRAHYLERQSIYAANDVARLDAYCAHYARPLYSLREDERVLVAAPWTASNLLDEAVRAGAGAELVRHLAARAEPTLPTISAALEADRKEVFEALMERVGDVHAAHFAFGSALSLAARHRRPWAVALLLARGAEPNAVHDAFAVTPPITIAAADGTGPMIDAVRNGDTEVLRLLLASGGDPESKTRSGRRVRDLATELGNAAVLEALGTAPARELDLPTAIAAGDVARVRALVSSQGSSEAISRSGQVGLTDVLRAALECSVPHDPKVLADTLWFAACNGHGACVDLLLAHGADPNTGIRRKLTARKVATDNGHTAIAAALAKAGGKLRVTG